MTYPPLPSISPRIDLPFNDGWRFHRGEAPGAHKPSHDDSAWRRVDLPHDWSIEDIPAGGRKPFLRYQSGTWKFRKGDQAAWKDPRLDDSAWQEILAPADWREHSKYRKKNAWGWYRRELELPRELEGKDFILDLGLIGEVSQAFLNGRSLGKTGSFPPAYKAPDWWNPLARYPVKAAWLKKDGPNVIALRVFSKMGTPLYHCALGRGGMLAESFLGDPSGPFDAQSVSSWATGYAVGGRGWYRKAFKVPKSWKGRRLELVFDGVYMDSRVWFNGALVAAQPYGYSSFRAELKNPRWGAGNVVSVQVRNDAFNSRWYSGSGIYRHVRLVAAAPLRIAHRGLSITTPQVHAAQATVQVAADILAPGAAQVLVKATAFGPDGRRVAAASAEALIRGRGRVEQSLRVEQPALWSPEEPKLHSLLVQVYHGGRLVDAWSGHFGIRSIAFSAGSGFLLNGRKTLLKGGCVHHDQGILGASAFDASEERKVRLMKENGFNAIRTSHNPPSSAFLDACDRLGMLVIDESFDMWQGKTNTHDYHRHHARWWKRDIAAMILRDRNHPSVLMWSTGNEIAQKQKKSVQLLSRLQAAYVRRLDPSRPVTEALSGNDKEWPGLDEYAKSHEVCGYNYMQRWYVRDHGRAPERVMYQSESSSQEIFESCMAMQELPYVIGDFVWTGYDYIGEASIGWYSFNWEKGENRLWTLAYCGDLDLLGHPRAQNLYRRTLWQSGPRVSAVVHSPFPTFGPRKLGNWGYQDAHAHWTWPGWEGRKLKVDLYTRCDKVVLLLNGRRIGSRKVGRGTKFMASFQVPYKPGALTALAYEGGRLAARCRLDTAGEPAALRLRPERPSLKSGGQDLAFIQAEVVDAKGRRVPHATHRLRVEVAGAGSLAGFGSANPLNIESFQDSSHPAFEGRALLAIRSLKSRGAVAVTARAPGLKPARLALKAL